MLLIEEVSQRVGLAPSELEGREKRWLLALSSLRLRRERERDDKVTEKDELSYVATFLVCDTPFFERYTTVVG